MASVPGSRKAGTKARKCEAAGPIHGTAILSLKVGREGGMFRGEMRIRSQGSVCQAKGLGLYPMQMGEPARALTETIM